MPPLVKPSKVTTHLNDASVETSGARQLHAATVTIPSNAGKKLFDKENGISLRKKVARQVP